MKYYEFIFRDYEKKLSHCICPETKLDFIKARFFREFCKSPHTYFLWINELDEHGQFVKNVQCLCD